VKSSMYPVQDLKRRTLTWAAKLRVNPKAIRVQKMRSKWGSCSASGTLTLAADLTEEDTRFQDYVIVHELLHLRITAHGRLFKALMSAHVPGWRELEGRSRGRDPTPSPMVNSPSLARP
jgi:predicted metal-dependent hydrolase